MTTWTPDNIKTLCNKMAINSKKFTGKQYPESHWQWYLSHVLFGGRYFFYYDKKEGWTKVDLGFYTDISVCLLPHTIFKALYDYLKLCKQYKDTVQIEDDGSDLILTNQSNGNHSRLTLKALFGEEDIQIVLDHINSQRRQNEIA